MTRFSGKVVVVTGAGSGQGYACAVKLADEGAQVYAIDVNAAGLDALAAAQPRVNVRPGDISDAVFIDAVYREIAEQHGHLDVLLNCAAILRIAPFESASSVDFDLLYQVNVKGTYLTCQGAIPLMRSAGGGSIVNWGSINSHVAEHDISLYAATKGAVLMLTKSIAIEHGKDDIRANCLCPGAVMTPMNDGFFEAGLYEDREAQKNYQPLGFASADDVADVALFLASNDSRMMTGSSVFVDGGFTAL